MASKANLPADVDEVPPTGVSPLPYVVIFAILVIILITVITMAIYYWSKAHMCGVNPHIWCSDNYTCNQSCEAGSIGHSECFNADHLTDHGLASCLYGPDAPGAGLCFNPPTTGTNELACDCVSEMNDQSNNCFSGCASKIGAVNQNTVCCCTPGKADCPFTEETLPLECLSGNQ